MATYLHPEMVIGNRQALGSYSGTSTPGYESPSEELHPPHLSSPYQAQNPPQSQPIALVPLTHGSNFRPSLMRRSSFAVGSAQNRTANLAVPTIASPDLNNLLSQVEKAPLTRHVGIKDRIACYQWTYFTMTMATGGIANVLHALNYSASWLSGIGIFFFLLNIAMFLTNCIFISMRFYMRPGSFTNSFTDQVESLFIPSFFVSFAIILINICEYGIPKSNIWLLRTMEIMFWIYVAVSVFASAGMYLVLWSTLVFPVHMMTPTWVFPAYPLLLTAPFATTLIAAAQRSGNQLSIDSTAIALCATSTQGTGCLIAFMISAAFLYRLMTQKLPRDMQRPGVFISIGPFGFTAGSIVQLGGQAEIFLPENFLGIDTAHTVAIVRVMSLLVGLWLWGLSLWFFLVSVGSLWKYVRTGHSMPFQMTWWSFVFPNTALVTATEVMANVLDSRGIHIFANVMTAALIVVWIGVLLTMIHCLRTKKLLWPKDTS